MQEELLVPIWTTFRPTSNHDRAFSTGLSRKALFQQPKLKKKFSVHKEEAKLSNTEIQRQREGENGERGLRELRGWFANGDGFDVLQSVLRPQA